MNLEQEAQRGVWLSFPVFGGMFSGGIKKHFYTPIAKYYKFYQCGCRIAKIKTVNDQIESTKEVESSFSSQIFQRRLNSEESKSGPITDRIENLAISNSLDITINGEWGPWSSWSSCSLSCGKGGIQRRQRECDDPTPRGKGMTCVGEDNQSKPCVQTTMCPNQGMQNSHKA